MSKKKILLIRFYVYNILFNSFFFILLSSPHPYYNFYFIYYFVNYKLSEVTLSLNFIFSMHYPVSNSLASCGQYFCNIICLLIKFVVVVNKRFFILSSNKHPCHFHIGVPITGHFSDNFQLLNNPMPSYSYSLDHHYQCHDFGMEQKHGLIVSLITKF